MKPILCCLLLLIICGPLSAQNKPQPLPSEVAATFGLLSHYQFVGMVKGPLLEYMDMPSGMSTAAFITGKKFFTDRLAVGFAIGMDNQTGILSYGNPKTHSYTSFLPSGKYQRSAYTLGAEFTYIYDQVDYTIHYGVVGIGYTYSFENYSFVKDVHNPSSFYGPNGNVPTNPYKQQRLQFTGNVTLYGISYERYKVHFKLELGYGYKGMIYAGAAYPF